MTFLQRSCQACAKARRHCNLATPCCQRCSVKRIKCCYINQPAPATADESQTNAIKPLKQAIKLGGAMSADNLSLLVARGELDTGLQMYIRQVLRDGYYQGSRPPLTSSNVPVSSFTSPSVAAGLRIFNPLHLEVVRVFDQVTLNQLSSTLRTLPVEFAEKCKTIFIHPGIHNKRLPPPLKNIRDICYSYQVGGDYLAAHRLDALRSTIRRLLRVATRTASFSDTLAYAQAISIAQIIRLLICEDPCEDDVERDNEDMWALTHRLWQNAPIQLSSTLSPWQAWLFSESVRRTIMVCNILLAVYNSLKRGYTMHSLCVEALPFDIRTQLWDPDTGDEWEAMASTPTNPSLVSLSQFTALQRGSSGGSRFEDLLLLSFGI